MAVSNRVFNQSPTACRGALNGMPWGDTTGPAGGWTATDARRRRYWGPCPPTAAVLAQILVRSPDFSVCERIVDGGVVLIVGIEGSTARAQEEVVGCVEERDGWHVDNHAVAAP